MKMARHTFIAVCAILSLLVSWPSHAAELVVSAAASLTNAFTDLGRAFENSHPRTKVIFNFGGSGQLLQQIAKGAPVDVFASADQETMDQAESKGLIDIGSRVDFARNALVVVVPIDSKRPVRSLGQLQESEFRQIAIGNPENVPAGRYSKAALLASGVWNALQGKLINTQNVRQSLDYVARGEVDAAFVYRTDAAIRPDHVRIALEVPTTAPILYPIATITGTSNKTDASAFVAFVLSGAAQRILRTYGFGKP